MSLNTNGKLKTVLWEVGEALNFGSSRGNFRNMYTAKAKHQITWHVYVSTAPYISLIYLGTVTSSRSKYQFKVYNLRAQADKPRSFGYEKPGYEKTSQLQD